MENLIDIGLNLMHKSFRKDRVEIIEQAKEVGVNQFIITGTNINSSQLAAEYASKYPGTLYSMGTACLNWKRFPKTTVL